METPHSLTLSLTSDDLSDNQRARLTRELEDALRRAEGVEAVERPSHPIESPLEPRTKSGDPVMIGRL